jgi:hypothetical protein
MKTPVILKDVEEFMPVYQDSTDPAREFRTILKEVGFLVRNCEVFSHCKDPHIISIWLCVCVFVSGWHLEGEGNVGVGL